MCVSSLLYHKLGYAHLINVINGVCTGESYQKTDTEFLDSEKDTTRDDGSTASTAVLVGNHLFVANVGDSRTVISKAGRGITLFNRVPMSIQTHLYCDNEHCVTLYY